MMASGDLAYQSYDGVLLLLMDIFYFIHSNSFHHLTAIKEMLTEVKQNLQHMVYAVTVITDRFPDALLRGFNVVLLEVFQSIPILGANFREPVKNYRLQLAKDTRALEFVIDSNHMQEPGVLDAVKAKQREEEISDFRFKILEADQINGFLGNCFLRYLSETKQQIYDIYYFFDSPQLFDVCLHLRTCFSKFGFKFQQALAFIVNEVYNEEKPDPTEPLDLPRVTKCIIKLIQKANPVGKKAALRGEKIMKMNAMFQYVADQTKPKKPTGLEVDDDDLYFNIDSIYQEAQKMKAYSSSWQITTSCYWMRDMIQQILGYFDQSNTLINPYDLVAYISIEFSRDQSTLESPKINQLVFYNQVFELVDNADPDSAISSHFQTFLRRLQLANLDTTVLQLIRNCASIRLETEGFRFLVNLIKHSEEFFLRIIEHFLHAGDELFHFTKTIFSKESLEALSDLIFQGSHNTLRLKLCDYFLQFVTQIFNRIKERFGHQVLVRCDKFAFHFTRRMGEYVLALNHFFAADLHNVHVE